MSTLESRISRAPAVKASRKDGRVKAIRELGKPAASLMDKTARLFVA